MLDDLHIRVEGVGVAIRRIRWYIDKFKFSCRYRFLFFYIGCFTFYFSPGKKKNGFLFALIYLPHTYLESNMKSKEKRRYRVCFYFKFFLLNFAAFKFFAPWRIVGFMGKIDWQVVYVCYHVLHIVLEHLHYWWNINYTCCTSLM